MARATVLLPPASTLASGALPVPLARALGRADAPIRGESGRKAQLQRHCRVIPATWPVAAWMRQHAVGDAALSAWLLATPCHLHPDMNGVRVLAVGQGMQVDAEDARALMPTLRPLFGDAGLLIDAPAGADHWFVQLPKASHWPKALSEPEALLGDDLAAHLPQGHGDLRWRALLNEIQISLHHHPWNARRVDAGLLPINGLWLWGGGVLPDSTGIPHDSVTSDDALLQAITAAAGVPVRPFAQGRAPDATAVLLDAAQHPDADSLLMQVAALADDVAAGRLQRIALDCLDGMQWTILPHHRRRFWRRPRGWGPT